MGPQRLVLKADIVSRCTCHTLSRWLSYECSRSHFVILPPFPATENNLIQRQQIRWFLFPLFPANFLFLLSKIYIKILLRKDE